MKEYYESKIKEQQKVQKEFLDKLKVIKSESRRKEMEK